MGRLSNPSKLSSSQALCSLKSLFLTKAKPGFGSLLVSIPERQPRSGMQESEALTPDCVGKSKRNSFVVFACDTDEPQKVQLGFSSKAW